MVARIEAIRLYLAIKMAIYKVIQDIEAEDKLLGPLTLRQFIYGAVSAIFLYLSFLSLTKHASFLLILFLPVALAAGFFAFPWSLNQPTEVWALAKIRFFLKPHRRIWSQSGIKELVTITAPKRTEPNLTNGLSQTEVKSRLKALADTIDSRGWAIKNVNVNLSSQPMTLPYATSDRLIDVSALPQEVPAIDIQASDDILDPQNNPVAQHFEQMISASNQSRREQITQKLRDAAAKLQGLSVGSNTTDPKADYWFLNGGGGDGQAAFKPQLVRGNGDDQPLKHAVSADEAKLSQELKSKKARPRIAYSKLHTLKPLSDESESYISQATVPEASVTHPIPPGILNLAQSNDFDVATLARQAKQITDGPDQNEVVVPLR